MGTTVQKIVLVFAATFSLSAFSAETEVVTCHLKTADVGNIVGRGSSTLEAQENARIACTDRRVAFYEEARGVQVDESRMTDLIDSCVNLECSR